MVLEHHKNMDKEQPGVRKQKLRIIIEESNDNKVLLCA